MRKLHEINKERFALMHDLSLEFVEKHPNLKPDTFQFDTEHNEYVHRDPRVIALNMEARAAWDKEHTKG